MEQENVALLQPSFLQCAVTHNLRDASYAVPVICSFLAHHMRVQVRSCELFICNYESTKHIRELYFSDTLFPSSSHGLPLFWHDSFVWICVW